MQKQRETQAATEGNTSRNRGDTSRNKGNTQAETEGTTSRHRRKHKRKQGNTARKAKAKAKPKPNQAEQSKATKKRAVRASPIQYAVCMLHLAGCSMHVAL